MKAWIGAALLAVLLVNPASAGAPGRDGGGRPQQAERAGGDGRGAQRQPPDDRRAERQPPQRRNGSLTDEERQALHRDLDKANRELYRRR